MESSSSRSNGGVIVTRERKSLGGGRLESPFTLKVGQVFTGFGIGCGVGIGVGRPINLSVVPMVGQMMSSARGATYAFSGVTRHVNNALRKVGATNVQAGIGCGVGFGHGFGIGLAVKPVVVHKIQSCLVQMVTKLMTKFGVSSNSPIAQGALPASLQSSLGMMNDPSNQNPGGSIMQLPTNLPDHTTQGLPGLGNMGLGSLGNMGPAPLGNMGGLRSLGNMGPAPLGNMGGLRSLGNMGPAPLGNMGLGSSYESLSSKTPIDTGFGSRTEKVLSSFLQNPLLKEEDAEVNQAAGRLRSENNMLQMVLKHQKVIDDLMEENDKLRRILVEDLKVPPSKLQASHSSTSTYPCSDCFECRRKQRRK